MRAVRISLVLLLAMAAVMVACVAMNGHVCGRMKDLVNALPAQTERVREEQMAELSAFWSKWSERIRPTVNASLWRTVNDLTGDVVYTAVLVSGRRWNTRRRGRDCLTLSTK